jgi:hypothetical protein
MSKALRWNNMGFGKYPGKTLPQLLLNDPDYFFWAIENHVFINKPHLKEQAEILDRRARSVKIPVNENNKLQVEHIISPVNYSYARFDIEPSSKPVHRGGSPAYRSKYVDFSAPKQFRGYDKAGYKLFISSFKQHILKNRNARLTKKVCEEFFSNPGNFGNP